MAPHFWGREESQLTELERLQCDRYRRDLDNYNLFLQQQELARANLLSLKEAEIAALERELRLQADLVKNTKQVVLYMSPKADRALLNDQLLKIQDLLSTKGISELVVSDATKHPDLQELLNDPTKEFPTPLVVVRGSPVGDYKDLLRLEQAHKLDAILDGSMRMSDVFIQNPDAPELQLGALGSVLNAGESIVSSVGSLLYMPVALVNWSLGASAQPPQQPQGEEFTVVNTNWYGRELHRVFRFTDRSIERVHPSTREVRAAFPYSSINKVTRNDDTNIVIHYNDGQEDWIRCPAKDIDRILHLLIINYPDQLVIEGK